MALFDKNLVIRALLSEVLTSATPGLLKLSCERITRGILLTTILTQ